MAQWVRVCSLTEAPAVGQVMEADAAGRGICLANIGGVLSAMENLCPHREGPLGQGWIEGNAVVCPWHSWAFDVKTGAAEYPEGERVEVYALKVENEDVLVEIS